MPRSLTTTLPPSCVSAPALAGSAAAADLDAHHGSARRFHDACSRELGFAEHLSQWTEWLDGLLARRFATSVVLVGSVGGLIALVA